MSKANESFYMVLVSILIVSLFVLSSLYSQSQYELCMATGGVEQVGIDSVSCFGGTKGMNNISD